MHELAVCQSIISQVTQLCAEHQARSVSRITVSIGPLSGVEEKLLENAFPIASANSVASDALFETETSTLKVHCNICGNDSEATMNNLTCRHCENWQTEIISGDELLLKQVELNFEDSMSEDAGSEETALTSQG